MAGRSVGYVLYGPHKHVEGNPRRPSQRSRTYEYGRHAIGTNGKSKEATFIRQQGKKTPYSHAQRSRERYLHGAGQDDDYEGAVSTSTRTSTVRSLVVGTDYSSVPIAQPGANKNQIKLSAGRPDKRALPSLRRRPRPPRNR